MSAQGQEFLIGKGTAIADVVGDFARAWRREGGLEAPQVREHVDTEGEAIYLDSFDGLLHAEGLACSWEDGRLAVTRRGSGDELAGLTMATAPVRALPVSGLGEGRLRDLLEPILELRALLPLGRVRSRVRTLDLLAGEAKTVARIRVERPARLGARVRVIGLRGYGREAELACRLLAQDGRLEPASAPLGDEAMRAEGHPPEGIVAKVKVELSRGTRADAAAAAVLIALAEVISANLDGTVADLDPEFLHDLRVSVRRSRAVQRELGHVFPPAELARFRAEFKWLQQATGDSRDLDVYLHEYAAVRALLPDDMRAPLAPLQDVLEKRRAEAHDEMRRDLRSARTVKLLESWRGLLEQLPSLPDAERPDAAKPIEELAAARIAKVYRRMVKMGSAIGLESPAEDYHELRKKGKELRYLLELFGAPLFDDDVVGPMIKTLKGLQDVLGRHQDREVQQETLRELGAEVATRPGGADALLAMGALLLRLAEEEREARSEFAESFAAFAAKGPRKLVKDTFT